MKLVIDSTICVFAIVFAFIAYHFSQKPGNRPGNASVAVSAATPDVTSATNKTEISVAVPEEVSVQNEVVESLTSSEEATINSPENVEQVNPIVTSIAETEEQPFERFSLVLPTDNEEIFDTPDQFYMHTNRYKNGVNLKPWEGGKYGFSRTPINTRIGVVYSKLHEGMDVKPLHRDANGEPLDEVRSISDGKVVYVNASSSRSNYGKYIVVEHDWPDGKFYSLYAHLSETSVNYKDYVKAGTKIGILGYTGDGISKDRAHVHVELAFMASPRFNTSYSPGNGHYNYNGINLVGMDVARLFKEYRKNPNITMREFLDMEEPYFTVRTKKARRPGILDRHPWLGEEMALAPESKSWEVTFNRCGVPLTIRPSKTASKYNMISWVKDSGTNHSYMTSGRVVGSGSTGSLSSKGHRFISLICETF